jgi:hypothetical protein
MAVGGAGDHSAMRSGRVVDDLRARAVQAADSVEQRGVGSWQVVTTSAVRVTTSPPGGAPPSDPRPSGRIGGEKTHSGIAQIAA